MTTKELTAMAAKESARNAVAAYSTQQASGQKTDS
jgi:hypothetical protein